MPVHANSVLSTQIQTFNEDFYLKLADMEYYTYENSTREPPPEYTGTAEVAGYDQYSPFWQAYSDAIVGYLQSTLAEETLRDFIIGLYAFLSRHEMQGYGDPAKKDESNATTIFDMDGLIATVMGYNVDYYDDYVFSVPDPETGEDTEPEAPNLEADTAHLLDDPETPETDESAFSTDVGVLNSLQAYFVNTATSASIDDIFGNAAPQTGDFTPQIAWDLIFDTLNWKSTIEAFGWNFDVPPRPEQSSPEPFDPTLPSDNN